MDSSFISAVLAIVGGSFLAFGMLMFTAIVHLADDEYVVRKILNLVGAVALLAGYVALCTAGFVWAPSRIDQLGLSGWMAGTPYFALAVVSVALYAQLFILMRVLAKRPAQEHLPHV